MPKGKARKYDRGASEQNTHLQDEVSACYKGSWYKANILDKTETGYKVKFEDGIVMITRKIRKNRRDELHTSHEPSEGTSDTAAPFPLTADRPPLQATVGNSLKTVEPTATSIAEFCSTTTDGPWISTSATGSPSVPTNVPSTPSIAIALDELPAPAITTALSISLDEPPAASITIAPAIALDEPSVASITVAPAIALDEPPAASITIAPAIALDEPPVPSITVAPAIALDEPPAPSITKAPAIALDKSSAILHCCTDQQSDVMELGSPDSKLSRTDDSSSSELDDSRDESYQPSETSAESDSMECFFLPTMESAGVPTEPENNRMERHAEDDDCTMVYSGQAVRPSQSSADKRVWDKRHACLYCGALVSKISRHLQTQHKNEKDICRLTKSNREKEIERIRLLGDFYHNCKVKETKEGHIIVVRRPKEGNWLSSDQYLPCHQGKGFFLVAELWRHTRSCKFNDDDIGEDITKVGVRESKLLMFAMEHSDIDERLCSVLSSMTPDEVTSLAKSDKLIRLFGKSLIDSKGSENAPYVRNKVREMGRLLLRVRTNDQYKDVSLAKCVSPVMFDAVLKAVHAECKFAITGRETPSFEIPSLALKLGHSLRKCCNLKIGIAIREQDAENEKKAEAFLKLLDLEYSTRVSSIALSTLTTNKARKVGLLPLMDDIVEVQQHLTSRLPHLAVQVKSNPVKFFSDLAKTALTRLITFNKRRSGEMARMLCSDYVAAPDTMNSGNADIFNMLSASEKELGSRLKLIHIRGKRGRTVPVILTPDTIEPLNILCSGEWRAKSGISAENKYVFASSRNSTNAIRGCAALKSCISEVDMKAPKAFTSTNLRKYVATVSQILDMKENEIDWLASHLGHDIRVHRNYYRLQDHHIELAKISKLLMATDAGAAANFAGKRLDDINIEDIEGVKEGCDPSDGVVDKDSDEEEEETDEDNNAKQRMIQTPINDSTSEPGGSKPPASNGKRTQHNPWSKEEKRFIMAEFRDAIANRTLNGVGKSKCEEAKRKANPLLQTRTWVQIKSCVKNIISRIEKQAFASRLGVKEVS